METIVCHIRISNSSSFTDLLLRREDDNPYPTWNELASYMGSSGWDNPGKNTGCWTGYPEAFFDHGSLCGSLLVSECEYSWFERQTRYGKLMSSFQINAPCVSLEASFSSARSLAKTSLFCRIWKVATESVKDVVSLPARRNRKAASTNSSSVGTSYPFFGSGSSIKSNTVVVPSSL